MKNIIIGILTILVLILGLQAFSGSDRQVPIQPAEQTPDDNESGTNETGLVQVERNLSFSSTTDAIRSAIESNENLTLMTEVDHSANAENAGLPLELTTLFIFGNPNAGTPLMQESDSTAIDLPQKMLVTERNGQVVVYYNDPDYLAERHTIRGEDARLENISGLLERLANTKEK